MLYEEEHNGHKAVHLQKKQIQGNRSQYGSRKKSDGVVLLGSFINGGGGIVLYLDGVCLRVGVAAGGFGGGQRDGDGLLRGGAPRAGEQA